MKNLLKDKKVIIFDFDGTLADTVGIWNEVDYRAIKEMSEIETNLDVIQNDRDKVVTENNNNEVYEIYTKYLIDKYKIDYPLEYVIKRRREIAYEYIIKEIDYKQNADKVLIKLKELGYILVLATTTARRTINNYNEKNNNLISKAKFDKIFDLILSNDEVKEKKLSPEIYLKVLEKLKVDKTECLVVEDSIEGVKSAKSAGIEVVNIPDKYSKNNQKEIDKLADYKIKNFDEFLKLISRKD